MQEINESSPFLQEVKGVQFTFSSFLTKVFGLMSIGLLFSFSIAFLVLGITWSNKELIGVVSVLAIPSIILQLVIVFGLSFLAERVNATIGTILFLFYSTLTGLTLGLIMMSYSLLGIVSALGATFLTFGTMAIFGYVTKRDLSGVGSLAFMGLIGLILASIFNVIMSVFFNAFSEPLYWITTYIGVAIFMALTAWDIQKLKRISQESFGVSENRLAVFGALTLYLDFINLFIYMLRIFGRRD